MVKKNIVVYLKSGDFQVISFVGDVFRSYDRAGIKSTDVDFYTDARSGRFVFENGNWIRGENPAVEEMLDPTAGLDAESLNIGDEG